MASTDTITCLHSKTPLGNVTVLENSKKSGKISKKKRLTVTQFKMKQQRGRQRASVNFKKIIEKSKIFGGQTLNNEHQNDEHLSVNIDFTDGNEKQTNIHSQRITALYHELRDEYNVLELNFFRLKEKYTSAQKKFKEEEKMNNNLLQELIEAKQEISKLQDTLIQRQSLSNQQEFHQSVKNIASEIIREK